MTTINTTVKIKMDPGCEDLFPTVAHEGDAACDLRAEENVRIYLNEVKVIPVGFCMELEPGWEAQIRPRSGLAAKHGLMVTNSPGTVDCGFRGKVGVILKYTGTHTNGMMEQKFSDFDPCFFDIKRGDRIAQMVISRVPTVRLEKVDSLSDTARGTGGFGSTGVK